MSMFDQFDPDYRRADPEPRSEAELAELYREAMDPPVEAEHPDDEYDFEAAS